MTLAEVAEAKAKAEQWEKEQAAKKAAAAQAAKPAATVIAAGVPPQAQPGPK